MDRMDKLELEVSALCDDNQQLHKTVTGMQKRMNALALRALADGARTKLNGGQVLSTDDKSTWNDRVQRGELDQHGLTRQQLALTKFGSRSLQSAAHLMSPEDVAYAATTRGANHRALFQFVFGVPAETYVYEESDEEEPN